MKVLATADLHGNLPEIDDCDVLLIAGDICPDFPSKAGKYDLVDKGGQMQAYWLGTAFRGWLEALRERDIQVVGIAGNHDFVFEQSSLIPDLPWTYLRDQGVRIEHDGESVNIWGTPWVPGLPRWAFYASSEALQARAESIPAGVDILMTHGPPYGVADVVGPKYGARENTHVGDEALLDELQRIDPKAVVCGHIHEGFGIYEATPSLIPVYNVSLVDEGYVPTRVPCRIWEV